MSSTNKTSEKLPLSQFIATDKPTWLQDYNTDMSKIDKAITERLIKPTGTESQVLNGKGVPITPTTFPKSGDTSPITSGGVYDRLTVLYNGGTINSLTIPNIADFRYLLINIYWDAKAQGTFITDLNDYGVCTGFTNNLPIEAESRGLHFRIERTGNTLSVVSTKHIVFHANSVETYGTTLNIINRIIGVK